MMLGTPLALGGVHKPVILLACLVSCLTLGCLFHHRRSTHRKLRVTWFGLLLMGLTAYTVLQRHPAAMRGLRWRELKRMGEAVDSWWAVDTLAVLAGTAWREGRISDYRVGQWTRSPNRWWRRTALVCTVCLNRKSLGGEGDAPRTLAVCEALVADRDDMVVKALSWALRDLSKRDRGAVERFLAKHEEGLAARVKREVRCKLETGRKSPRRG